MNSKIILSSLLALGLSGLTASACTVQITVACEGENGKPAEGVHVCITTAAGIFCADTDEFGYAEIPNMGNVGTWPVCVDLSSLPQHATLATPCQNVTIVEGQLFAPVEFILGGDYCEPGPPGPCWLTGGGTLDKTKGVPHYSFGGVVYPGCSPKAAEGGNWNVVDHFTGLHFQGQQIIVDSCSGVSTKSPKVNVNIIDFHGTGIVSGIGGNPLETVAVTFVGRAIDNLEPGGGKDLLYLSVSGGLMQIGTSPAAPELISTGNLQIHTTGCNK